MIEYYNIDKLIKISVLGKQRDYFSVFKKEIKFLGLIFREAGMYRTYGDKKINTNNLENHEMFNKKENVIYTKPSLTFLFTGNHTYSKYFETYEDAGIAALQFIKKHNLSKKMINFKKEEE